VVFHFLITNCSVGFEVNQAHLGLDFLRFMEFFLSLKPACPAQGTAGLGLGVFDAGHAAVRRVRMPLKNIVSSHDGPWPGPGMSLDFPRQSR
jgi:hypothetical protein